MNLENKILQQADLDSRRVSTGILCTIVRENISPLETNLNGVLALLKKYGGWPKHIDIAPTSGIDVETGICMVAAKSSLRFIEETMKQVEVDKDGIAEDYIKEMERIEAQSDSKEEKELALQKADKSKIETDVDAHRAIRDHVIMASVDLKQFPDSHKGGNKYDVYVHSREQAQFRSELLRKNRHVKGQIELKWSDRGVPSSPHRETSE